MMYIIYILWLVVATRILSPNKPSGSEKLPRVIGDFRHAATYIVQIGDGGLRCVLPTKMSDGNDLLSAPNGSANREWTCTRRQ